MRLQGAYIGVPQLLEDRDGDEEGLDGIHQALGRLDHLVADARNPLEHGLHVAREEGVDLPVDDPLQVAGPGAHVGGDGHFVVVQNNDHFLFQVSHLIDALEGHAHTQPGITDEGSHLEIFPVQIARGSQPKRR